MRCKCGEPVDFNAEYPDCCSECNLWILYSLSDIDEDEMQKMNNKFNNKGE